MRMFVRPGLVLTAVGAAVGLVTAIALTQWMSSLLFGVERLEVRRSIYRRMLQPVLGDGRRDGQLRAGAQGGGRQNAGIRNADSGGTHPFRMIRIDGLITH